MTNQDDHFRLLMHSVASGDENAARQLVEEFGDAIRRAVRRSLNARLRSEFDSLDFAQLVWCSVFRARESLDRFDRPGDLVAFLVTIARNKVSLEARRHPKTGKHGDNYEHESIVDASKEQAEIWDPHPAAIDEAIAGEKLERLLSDQPPGCRQIIQLRLQGMTHEEIAQSLHLTRGAVYRYLKRLSKEQA